MNFLLEAIKTKIVKPIKIHQWILTLIPIGIAVWVWTSALSFVPVPWPDDSAFYFVAKELFKWPPKWVMLPQAPFEPSYRIFNFNTMPLYPILIGLGRLLGIDGSFLLKIWPLSFWALSGSLLGVTLYKQNLPFLFCILMSLCFSLDPELRWASVLVRPESLIGLAGMALVFGLTFGFPERLKQRNLWDPIAALLAISAYAHFNAIHLSFIVLLFYFDQPKRLFEIGYRTLLYLTPWLISVLFYFEIFLHQMKTQWKRLEVPNAWLSSPSNALSGLFEALGSPEPWPNILHWASAGLWIFILLSIFFGIFLPLSIAGLEHWHQKKDLFKDQSSVSLIPSASWVLSSIWIYYSKPELWFIYYIHIAIWSFVSICAVKLWKSNYPFRMVPFTGLSSIVLFITGIFGYVDVTQANRLQNTQTWNWNTYNEFIDCIDQRLSQLESNLPKNRTFKVWDPTFPDITIELSRRHSHWEFTRTNDFGDRNHLAIRHGWEADAVVVTETLNWSERTISKNAAEVPEVVSTWMTWKPYFLNQLWREPGWKPNRYICQRGRWQAFIFMEPESNPMQLSKSD